MKLIPGISNACLSITLAMAASAVIATDVFASYPSGYYDSLEGKCGAELMRAVKAVAQKHTAIEYGNSTWDVFRDTDVKTVNGVDYWWDMYSNELVKVGSSKPSSDVMNIEHSVANSWWGKTKNDAYKDIVHLNPSNSDANSRKSNYPLAELSSVTWNNGVTYVGKPKSGQGGGSSYCYEPADMYKGDFARVFMYMFTIYNDISWQSNTSWMYSTGSSLMFQSWASALLLKWNELDPVSDKEINRNDGIYKHQKNRNPFIDLPELADHIWGSKSNVPFSLKGGNGNGGGDTPDIPDNPDTTDVIYSWLNATDGSMGEWTIENVTLTGNLRYIWEWKSYNGGHYLNGSAYVSGTNYASEGYAWSPEVSLTDAVSATVSFEHAAKFQTTLKTLCGFAVRDLETNTVSDVAIPAWPTAGNWNFVNSGNLDLSKFAGKKVQIGFRYKSDTSGADTWEIKNVKLTVKKSSSAGIENVTGYEEDDSFLVEVWGNTIIAPEGARIFDLNGREYNGENLPGGLYIVVKPSFRKAVKVVI